MGRSRAFSKAVVVAALLAVVAALLAAAGASGAGHRPARPVSPRLLRFLGQETIRFRPAGPGARPAISAATASRDAVRGVQWRPASAEGVSLVRLGPADRALAGTLAWVIALRPRHPLYSGSARARGPAANWMEAFIVARNGRFLGDAAGYSPELAGRSGGFGWAMGELTGKREFVT